MERVSILLEITGFPVLFIQAVNVTDGLKSDGRAQPVSGLKIYKEGGGDTAIHRTATRVSLTCRVVTRVHKHLIKL